MTLQHVNCFHPFIICIVMDTRLMGVQFNSFPDRDSMYGCAAGVIIDCLQRSLVEKQRVTMIASGGNTPKSLYACLSKVELPWHRITIIPADERWTDPASDQSNEFLIRSNLLINHAAEAKFIGLKADRFSVEQAISNCEEVLAPLDTPYDVVLLGMGDDGHTASLFPGADSLQAALDMKNTRKVMSLVPEPLPEHAPFARITMTLPAILNSRRLVLLITGESKLATYNAALAGDSIEKMPVRGILKQALIPVNVFWSP